MLNGHVIYLKLIYVDYNSKIMFITLEVLTIFYYNYNLSKLTSYADNSCTVCTANFNHCTCLIDYHILPGNYERTRTY